MYVNIVRLAHLRYQQKDKQNEEKDDNINNFVQYMSRYHNDVGFELQVPVISLICYDRYVIVPYLQHIKRQNIENINIKQYNLSGNITNM